MERRPRRGCREKIRHSEKRELGVATQGIGRDTTKRHVPSELKPKVKCLIFYFLRVDY